VGRKEGEGMIPFPDKKYQIIYADPPWSYKVWSEDKKQAQGCAKKYYETMSVEDICQLPVSDICESNTKLFLWATPPCLPEAIEVMKAWGFEYKTVVFTWIKLNKTVNPNQGMFFLADSIPRFYGIGHWTASNSEFVLGGLRKGGVLNRQGKNISL
jgi:N6-adenosine-specific RNA methylase IME4